MVTVKFMGGLGNQLFQYAFGMSISKQNKHSLHSDTSLLGNSDDDFYINRNFELLELFELEHIINDNISISNNWFLKLIVNKFNNIWTVHLNQNKHEINFIDYRSTKNLTINGRFQSELFFKTHRADIIKSLVFKDIMTKQGRQLITKIQNENSVAIHIRRGDYVSHPLFKESLGFVGVKYYLEAISFLKDKETNLIFYVFSDDIQWCINHLSSDVDFIFMKNAFASNHSHSDFIIMSNCRHHIIANSTFSWWSAYLNDKKHNYIIAPRNWSKNGVENNIHRIPEHWTIL